MYFFIMDISLIVNRIHSLEHRHHVYIGALLKKYPSVKFNENKSGVMINAATIPEEAFNEINDYICYIDKQDDILGKIECETDSFKQLIQN